MKKLILFALLAVLLLAAVKPAILTVRNRSDADLFAYLYPVSEDGASETPALYVTVPAHAENEYALPPGEYAYQVFGCDKVITGTVELRGRFTLLLPACARLEKAPQQLDGSWKFLPQ